MNKNIRGLIFTTSPSAEDFARDEVYERLGYGISINWLADGVGMAQSDKSWLEISTEFHKDPPLFIRHICPVEVVLEQPISLDDLAAQGSDFARRLNHSEPFSVQSRFLGGVDLPYKRYDINQRLAEVLQSGEGILDVRNPTWALSILLHPQGAFLGLSRTKDNLSDWGGGERRFKREPVQVSRAEFKLLEALEVFEVVIPPRATVLDLGAAPGGWTRILLERGCAVTAVDPAPLDPRVADHPQLTYERRSIHPHSIPDFQTLTGFRLITNDMRMDASDVVQILLSLKPLLHPSGLVITSLKLPPRSMRETAERALKRLGQGYEIIGARQLFHNRSEITAVLGLRH